MNFTQKLKHSCSIMNNEYLLQLYGFFCCLSMTNSEMWDFSLESATFISFSQQSLFHFFIFVYHPRKGLLVKIRCNKQLSISREFFAIIKYATMTPNFEWVIVLKSGCRTFFRWSSMISLTSVKTQNLNVVSPILDTTLVESIRPDTFRAHPSAK